MTTNSEQTQGENLVEEVRSELVEIDSMNVSVAAAILLFEAKRQRGF